ncbi:MAG: zinc ABC transporter substrate-binding protein [Alphaproteobacteria bacterium]|nr:zinc ABC transporter substrate-binding protein [Alphaproteobacteria bacterium]
MIETLQRGLTATFTAVAILAVGVSHAEEAPKVVASIKPLHSLVAGVMDGVGEPTLIIDGLSSPHGFSLKPSHVAAMNEADAVFWIGQALETSLDRPIDTLPDTVRRVALIEAQGMQLLRFREEADFEGHDHDHADHGHDDHDHDEHADEGHAHEGQGHGDHAHDEHAHDDHAHDDHAHKEHGHDDHALSQFDPHVWLDPRNAVVMVREIAATLSQVDPNHAETYRRNAADMTDRLNALVENVHAQLADAKGVPYAVFHDAYQYFEHRFELTAVGSVTVNPETPPSAERVREIQDKLKRLNVACIFTEPQFSEKVVKVAAEGSSAGVGQLDPHGVDAPAGPNHYFATIESLANSIATCLAANS